MRPDITARVFQMKLKIFMAYISKSNIFGKCVAHVQVIEFQKRGLPHSHLLIWLSIHDKPSLDTYNKFVSAEIPNEVTHPSLYKNVTNHLLHGPCGEENLTCVCMKDNVCTKKFPKDKSILTKDIKGAFPIYRRRCLHNHVTYNSKGDIVKDQTDIWVVPYNPFLTIKFNAHINIEICTTVVAIKYLFKYVHKGHDRASVRIEKDVLPHEPIVIDEIKKYVDARYLSASESFRNLYNFPASDLLVMEDVVCSKTFKGIENLE